MLTISDGRHKMEANAGAADRARRGIVAVLRDRARLFRWRAWDPLSAPHGGSCPFRPRCWRSRTRPGVRSKNTPSSFVTTAGLIAFIGTLDGLFAAVAIDNVTDGRHKTKREVVAHGFANVLSGLCGGLPVVLSRAVALASWNAGWSPPHDDGDLGLGACARARRSAVPLITRIPVAALSEA